MLDRLAPVVGEPIEPRESEELRVDVRPNLDEQIDLHRHDAHEEITIERLQPVADALARNVVLARYETRLASGFDRAEPMAEAPRSKSEASRARMVTCCCSSSRRWPSRYIRLSSNRSALIIDARDFFGRDD
ncbi:MAG TPA: hypothetical protein VGF92_08675 [Stellaceae bacterium]